MDYAFYIASAAAVVATVMVITRTQATHALLYLVASLLAVAVVFFTLGAAFVAALEVIVYAGAIMVLFVFVIMMLNVSRPAEDAAGVLLRPGTWLGPGVLVVVLLGLMAYLLSGAGALPHPVDGTAALAPPSIAGPAPADAFAISPKQVGVMLFTQYMLGVELASMLLLAALVGVVHLARTHRMVKEVTI